MPLSFRTASAVRKLLFGRGSPTCAKQVEVLWAQWVDSVQLGRVTWTGFEDRRRRIRVLSFWTENAPLRRKLRGPQRGSLALDGVLQGGFGL